MAKAKYAYMKCETRGCRNGEGGQGRVVLFLNEHKTLSYRCDECGATPYTREGTDQYKAWMRDCERIAADPPAAKPAPEPKPPAAPKPAPSAAPAKPARATTLLG